MVSPTYAQASESHSATALSLRFAESLAVSLTRCGDLDRRALGQLISAHLSSAISPLERTLCDVALAQAGDVKSAIAAVRKYAEERVATAATDAVKAASEHLKLAQSITLLSGSSLASRTAAIISPQVVSCLDSGTSGYPKCATRVAALDCAPDLLEGSSALVLGAHEVAMNGAVVCVAGTAVTAALARDFGIPIVVVAQTAKFSDSTLVAPVLGDHDVLQPSEVDVIVTEKGIIPAYMAPVVSKENRMTKE